MVNLEKVARFEEAINKAADGEINALLSDARKKAEEAVKCADEEYLENSYSVVAEETRNIKRKLEHEVSQKEFEASKEVFSHRSQSVDRFFEELEKELEAFSQTSEYQRKLTEWTEEIEKENAFNEKTVIYVKSSDVDIIKKHYPNVTVSADKKIRLGGVCVFYPERSVFSDKTFDSAFVQQKSEFVNNRIMQL